MNKIKLDSVIAQSFVIMFGQDLLFGPLESIDCNETGTLSILLELVFDCFVFDIREFFQLDHSVSSSTRTFCISSG